MNIAVSSVRFVPALPGGSYQVRRAGFALVVTLLIVSLLAIIAVSFLASMSSEHQTADAYMSKARAEQAAQAGVDAAEAILAQSFRDYPDSCTVWDTHQSYNTGAPTGQEASTTVTGVTNEGTSLYLHALATTGSANGASGTVANFNYTGVNTAANATDGNNPNDPACKTFVLPLISGVPGGYAQLASEVIPATDGSGNVTGPNDKAMLPRFDLTENDASKQTDSTQTYCTDLNVRRFGPSSSNGNKGDLAGIIGSPPDWSTTAIGPKPARALWVNLKGSDGRVTGRYAFWMEDESFRANISNLGSTTNEMLGQARADNTRQPQSGVLPRALTLADLSLPGLLNAIGDNPPVGDHTADTAALLSTRAVYPGGVFPDPRAFAHSTTSNDGSSAFTTTLIDNLRYSSTTQSGTLNFSRHGTQRLNLNGLFPTPTSKVPLPPQPQAVTQSAVDQIVETLKFHLPDFGQRFYRTTFGTDSTTLNARQVDSSNPGGDHATIYLYKVAANLCDYLDTDSQPTMILGAGNAKGLPAGRVDNAAITVGSGPLKDEQTNNTYWAQGKEASPLIQEVVVRYRPVVGTKDPKSPLPPRDFDLQIDYYIELWNMTDRDIYATQQSDTTLPHLNAASLFVRDQQPWQGGTVTNFGSSGGLAANPGDILTNTTLPDNGAKGPPDWQIDLSSSLVIGYDTSQSPARPVQQDGNNKTPKGVVFRAGSVTVITTDPDCVSDRKYPSYSYKFISPYYVKLPGSKTTMADNSSPVVNLANVFYCPLVAGQRDYTGHIASSDGKEDSQGAILPYGGSDGRGFTSYNVHFGTEVSLGNKYGYLDIVRGAIAKVPVPTGTGNIFDNTWKYTDPTADRATNYYNDFSFGSALVGNVAEPSPPLDSSNGISAAPTVSELGDPRTNNEQLAININSTTANSADGSHYVPGRRSLGTPNGLTVQPNLPTTTSNGADQLAWGDYFSMPGGDPSSNAATLNADYSTAPAVINDNPLISIGQLGDVYDPARLPGVAGIAYSRGGGRTFKLGQHDDRYSFDSSGNPPSGGNNTPDNVSASTGWASWRLADVFSIDDDQEKSGLINLNGVRRDNGAALMALLDGWNFQPATTSNAAVDWSIHGDGHSTSSLAGKPLATTAADPQHGTAQLVKSIVDRLNSAPASGAAAPSGPFFERGEFSELVDANNQPLFGTNSVGAVSTTLVNGVDMNKTFDHSREEMFRRLSELICTRGDTFTAYVVGQSIFQAPITNASKPPPMKVTGTHRLRVTFRLVPKGSDEHAFVPTPFDGRDPILHPISAQVADRFAKPDHYAAQVLEVNTY